MKVEDHLITQSPWTLFACYFVRIFPVRLLLETHFNSSICTVLNINTCLKSAERPTAPTTSPTSPEDHLILADSKQLYDLHRQYCSGSPLVVTNSMMTSKRRYTYNPPTIYLPHPFLCSWLVLDRQCQSHYRLSLSHHFDAQIYIIYF